MKKILAVFTILTIATLPLTANAFPFGGNTDAVDYDVPVQKIGINTPNITKLAQESTSLTWTDPWDFDTITLSFKKVGNPDVALFLDVYNGTNANPESNTLVKSSVPLNAGSFGNTCTTQTYNLDLSYTDFDYNTTHFVVSAVGTTSDTDYYVWCAGENTGSGWSGKYESGSWEYPTSYDGNIYRFNWEVEVSALPPPPAPETGFIKTSSALALATSTAYAVGSNTANAVPLLALIASPPLLFYIARRLIFKI